MIGFANQSVAGAREVGRFEVPVAFGGRGGGRGGGGGDDDAPAGGRGGRGAGGGRGGPTPPATTVDAADVEYFRTVSDRYRQLTGLRATPSTRIPGGAFFEYAYYQFGVPAFSTPGWGIAEAAPAGGRGAGAGAGEGRGAGPGGPGGGRGGGGAEAAATEAAGSATFDLRLVRALDSDKVDGFVAWQPFKHPTLGDVEIGGFRPYAAANPPAARIAELGKSHTEFVTYLSSMFPKVSIASSTVTSLGGGLYRIKAEVENSGFLPTSTAQGVRSRSVSPTMVQLGVEPDAIVSGAPKTNFFPTLAGSGRRQTYEWIIKGKPGSTVTLKAVAQKGGSASAALTLK
jgi:hypothetical protein